MIEVTDFLARVRPKARRVPIAATVSETNFRFVNLIAKQRKTDRSNALDQMLDVLREQYEAAKAEPA